MSKNYIIWGISDKGYENIISSSSPDNLIPKEFQEEDTKAFYDHRPYALSFDESDPNNNYFYSIQYVGSNVLYTIYRPFTGGVTANRDAYDAATIIISKNYIIEKPLVFLSNTTKPSSRVSNSLAP